jgi:uncharacterized membrane protein (DUF2068 family)
MTVPASSDSPRSSEESETGNTGARDRSAGPSRVLKCIAVERYLRSIVFVAVGIVLVTHAHTDWGRAISRLARHVGLDPRSNGVQRIITEASSISPGRYTLFGAFAIAFGVLEGAEGYGLWTGKRWGEYLTIFATSLFFIPEIWELADRPTLLKAGALAVNIAIVAYLL